MPAWNVIYTMKNSEYFDNETAAIVKDWDSFLMEKRPKKENRSNVKKKIVHVKYALIHRVDTI